MKREVSSIKKWKEVFCETTLCSINSSHRGTHIPFRSRSLRLFLGNLQSDISKPIGGYGEKGNIFS